MSSEGSDEFHTEHSQQEHKKERRTIKPVISGHSKIDKTNGSLMKVESIAECSLGAFCNTFDLH